MRWKGLGGTVHNPRKTVLSHFSSNDFNEHTVFLQVNTQVHFTFSSKLRSKQTCNYITQTMQKEPDSTGGFKKTTKWASDTHRSLPLSLSLPPLILNLQQKERMNEHFKGRKITSILSICEYLAHENAKHLLRQGSTAGGACFTATPPRWGHSRPAHKTPPSFTWSHSSTHNLSRQRPFSHWIIFPW